MEGLDHLLLKISQLFEMGNIYWPLTLVVDSDIKVKVLTLIIIGTKKESFNEVITTKISCNFLVFLVDGGGILVFNVYILKSSYCSALRLLYY